MIDRAAEWAIEYCRIKPTGQLEHYRYSRPAETSTRSGFTPNDDVCRDVLPSSGVYEDR